MDVREIGARHPGLDSENLDPYDLIVAIKIDDDPWLHFFRLDDGRIVETEIDRVGCLIVTNPHRPLLRLRSKYAVTTRAGLLR